MAIRTFLARNRWFILGLFFLLINSYAVYLYHSSLASQRNLRVNLLEPADGRVSGRGILRWRFSAAMVPDRVVGSWSAAGPVKITPDTRGLFCWTAGNELTFRPDSEWKHCTDFLATMNDTLQSMDARTLPARGSFTFHSDPLTLRRVSQTDYLNGHGLNFLLEFNAEVSPDQLRNALSITNSAGDRVIFRIDQNACSKTIAVRIPNDSSSEITLHLPAGLQSISGTRGLAGPVAWKTALSSELNVVNIAADSRSFCGNSIFVSFNKPVMPESIADFIRIDPPLTFSAAPGYCRYWPAANTIQLDGNFTPSMNYAVTFLKGLPAADGTCLSNNVQRTAYFPEPEPGLEITATGNYMSPDGNMILPFRTVGLNKCRVLVRRIYPNNLCYLAAHRYDDYNRYPGEGLSQDIAEKEIVIESNPNSPSEQRLALRELTHNRPGAFYVFISGSNGGHTEEAHHHVVVSDTGLSARNSGNDILVWANSIRTLAPVTNAAITVYSAENQELLSGFTDAGGLVRFTVDTNTIGGIPFLITARKGDDITYLALPECEVNSRGAAGSRPFLTSGYEAYLFSDRGIYRPGETTHLKAIIRGQENSCPSAFPVQLRVYRPDNRLDRTFTSMLSSFGTAEFAVAWPEFSPTGRYRFDLSLPSDKHTLGSTRVAVEEFVPPQIRVDVTTPPDRVRAGEEFGFDVRADYLFGRPAAGLTAEARVEFIPLPVAFTQFTGYVFEDPRKAFTNVQHIVDRKILSESGKALFSWSASAQWRPPGAVKALLIGTVTEVGGRAVTAYGGRSIDIYPFYIGIQRGLDEISAGSNHVFNLVTVAPDGITTSAVASLKVTVEKLTWTTVLKKGAHDSYSYCSEQKASRVISELTTLRDGTATFNFSPPGNGEYRIAALDITSGVSASLEFHACEPGQHWETRSMESPDVVELKLDKARYIPGDTATLVVKSPFPGKALISLTSTQLLSSQIVAMDSNSLEFRIPVEAGYAPNIYCEVTVIRPAVQEKVWGQHRASGLIPLIVEAPQMKATISLTAPDTIRPKSTLAIDVAVTDSLSNGIPAEVVISAVDEGICILTGFKSPDPYGYFTDTRLPSGRLHDIYSLLMPELEKSISNGSSTPGGDAMSMLGRRLNPVKARRFTPVALWSSTILTDSNGHATVHFPVPEFTGQLRLMAVAVGATQLASSEKHISVVRPLVVQSSLPRFLAPADRFIMPVQIINGTGSRGELTARVTCSGPLTCTSGTDTTVVQFLLPEAAQTNLIFSLSAGRIPGTATCKLEVTMGTEHFEDSVELPVRPPAGRSNITGAGRIPAGVRGSLSVPANWLQNTGSSELWVSPLPTVELGGGLDYLLNYPYGCLEQTISKSFPLLYLYDLALTTRPGWLDRRQVAGFVQDGIQRVLTMQKDDGSFSLWLGGDTYDWGTIYATHFLLEASKAGYGVPEERLTLACEHLEKWLSREHQEASDDYDRAYACYVLALAGRTPHAWMIRLREQKATLNRDAGINLGAAFIAAGKRKDGVELLRTAGLEGMTAPAREAGGSLKSAVRSDAMLLSALLDLDTDSELIPALVLNLERNRAGGRWFNTQENAMALLALGKYMKALAPATQQLSGTLTWKDAPQIRFEGTNGFHAFRDSTGSHEALLHNEGSAPLYYYWKSGGVPADGRIPEEDRALTVRREFLNQAGELVPPDSIRQGDLLAIRVTLDGGESELENIVIEDLLPAGLEIENANLNTSQTVSWCRERQTLRLLHVDIRDDRLIAFAGDFKGRQTFFYAVRAVTPGEYALPAIRAECMYDQQIRSVHGAGRIKIKAAGAP